MMEFDDKIFKEKCQPFKAVDDTVAFTLGRPLCFPYDQLHQHRRFRGRGGMKELIWKHIPANKTCRGSERWEAETDDGFKAVIRSEADVKPGSAFWEVKVWGPDTDMYGHAANAKAARRVCVAIVAAARSAH